MKTSELKKIEDLIGDDSLEAAIDKFIELRRDFNEKDNDNSARSFQGQLSRAKKSYEKGELNQEKYNIKRSQISNHLLDKVRNLKNKIMNEELNDDDGFEKLKDVLFEKIKYEAKCFDTLGELESSENIIKINTIKNLIKYEYRLSKDTRTKITLKLNDGKKLKLKEVLSYGLHTILIKAEDQNRDPIVLKILQPQFFKEKKEEFIKRHKLQKELKSNNIAKVLGDKVEQGQIVLFKIQEYNQNLKEFVLKSHASNDYHKKICDIFIFICNGLKYLHKEQDMAHRDIGPTNILLNTDNEAFIADFDNIFIKGAEKDMREKTIEKNHIYFDIFIAPEYITNLKSPNPSYKIEQLKKHDLYSLCVTLLFCVLKRRLNGIEVIEYLKPNIRNEVYAVDLLDHPVFNFKINKRLRKFLIKGLNKNEKIRFSSIDELVTEFYKIKDSLNPTEPKINKLQLKSWLPIMFFCFAIGVISIFASLFNSNKLKNVKEEYKIYYDWIQKDGNELLPNVTTYPIDSFLRNYAVDSTINTISNLEQFDKYKEVLKKASVPISSGQQTFCNSIFNHGVTFNFGTYHFVSNLNDSIKKNELLKKYEDLNLHYKTYGNLAYKLVEGKVKGKEYENKCYNLGDIFGVDEEFLQKFNVLFFFSYYHINEDIQLYFRYPAPRSTPDEINDYNPKKRTWFIEMKKKYPMSEDIITGLTKSYNDIKITNKEIGKVRTLYTVQKYDDDSYILYAIDFTMNMIEPNDL